MDSEDPAENGQPTGNLRRWVIIAVLIVIVAALAFAAPPLYRAAKQWRAEQLITQAIELRETGEFATALERAQAAYALAPYDFDVLRELARLYEPIHPGRASQLWENLLAHEEADRALRIAYAEFLLRRRDWAAFDAEWARLRAEEATPALLVLAGQGAVMREDWVTAYRFFEEARRQLPQKEGLALQTGRAALKAGELEAGTALLWEIARKGGERGRQALEWLLDDPRIDPEVLSRIRTVMEGENDLEAQLLRAEIDLRLGTRPRDGILEQVLLIAGQEEADGQLAAARWFNQQRHPDWTLRLIDEERAMQRRDLFLVRADALALLRQWDELKRWITDERVPVEEVVAQAFEARIALELGDEVEAGLRWQKAVRTAARRPEPLWFLTDYAVKLKQTDWAIECLERLAESGPTRRTAFLTWLRLLQGAGRTEEMRKLLGRMMELFPDSVEVRNDFAYVLFLLKQDPELASRTTQQLLEESPSLASVRVTAALGLLRGNEPEKAWQLFEGFPDSPADWRPAWRAVGAAAAAQAGQTEQSAKLRADLPTETLLPEEAELLEKIRN